MMGSDMKKLYAPFRHKEMLSNEVLWQLACVINERMKKLYRT